MTPQFMDIKLNRLLLIMKNQIKPFWRLHNCSNYQQSHPSATLERTTKDDHSPKFLQKEIGPEKNKLFLDTEINHSMAVLTSIAWHMTLISSSTIQNNWHWWINRPDPTISLRTKLGKDLFANHTFIENSKFTFANFDTSRGTQASTLFMAAAEPTSSLVKQGTTGFEK